MHYDVIIIGGGAAGLFCAGIAGQRGRKVLVLERAEKVGKKILISGGGRCNFTNIGAKAENYLSANPNFAKSAFARYPPQTFISLVQRYGIAYHEKKLGQLFCDGPAQQIVDLLLQECAAGGVTIKTGCDIRTVAKSDHFTLNTNQGNFTANALVVAAGGLSIPKMGATDFGYRLARQFGIKLIPTRPALVPFTFTLETVQTFAELSGVSVDAIVSIGKRRFRENILFTHRGLSGPAILQISSYWQPRQSVAINLLPEQNAAQQLMGLQDSNVLFSNWLAEKIPQRFARAWTKLHTENKPLSRFSQKEMRRVAEKIHHWELLPDGTEGYMKAEVTSGGVDTTELSSKTMESNQVPGLYFIGEVVDVTGQLGGYNFQWAWASGHAAGQAV